MPRAQFDERFSDPQAEATAWEEVEALLAEAELFWLTTVRADGRPHVTPLVAVADDGVMHFTTGLDEQKARNLETNSRVALTTGNNTWAQGLDVVVEGTATRVTDTAALQRIAAAYDEKYGGDWHFEVGDGVFVHSGDSEAAVFRVEPSKVLAFAKDPHGQTSYRF
jgi:PPOX class probable F420-dependent enzyme